MFRKAPGRIAAQACTAAISAALPFAPAAVATPGNGASSVIVAPLECSDGSTYTLSATQQSYQWASATDLDTGAKLIPVYFGNVDLRFYSADGNTLIDQELIEQYEAKGTTDVALAGGVKDCEFTDSAIEVIPGYGEVLVWVTVQVGVVVAPR